MFPITWKVLTNATMLSIISTTLENNSKNHLYVVCLSFAPIYWWGISILPQRVCLLQTIALLLDFKIKVAACIRLFGHSIYNQISYKCTGKTRTSTYIHCVARRQARKSVHLRVQNTETLRDMLWHTCLQMQNVYSNIPFDTHVWMIWQSNR